MNDRATPPQPPAGPADPETQGPGPDQDKDRGRPAGDQAVGSDDGYEPV